MKKKVTARILAIAFILAGVVLLGFCIKGIANGNRYFDLFKKIDVKIQNAYDEIDSKGLDQVKADYRSTYAIVDTFDTAGKDAAAIYLDEMHDTYGLIDTLEITDVFVQSINTLGADRAQECTDEVFAAISKADKAFKKMNDVGPDTALDYLDGVSTAIETYGLEDARAKIDEGNADMDKETRQKADSFLDFVFQTIKDSKKALEAELPAAPAAEEAKPEQTAEEGQAPEAEQPTEAEAEIERKAVEQAMAYLTTVAASEQSSVEFTQQQLTEKYQASEAEDKDQALSYIASVFRLVEDLETNPAKSFIKDILKTVKEQGISDIRAFMDHTNESDPVKLQYLQGIYRMIDENGIEYAKLHCGDINEQVTKADAEAAPAVLSAMRSADPGSTGAEGEYAARLARIREAISQDQKLNHYLTDVYAIDKEVGRAIDKSESDASKAERDAGKLADAEKALEAAQALLDQADTEENKTAVAQAQEALDLAIKKYRLSKEDADNSRFTETKARKYLDRLLSAMDLSENLIQPESREFARNYQNSICALIQELGLKKAMKYMNGNLTAFNQKESHLRISELGTDNSATLEALDSSKLFCMRNKALLMILAAVALVIGLALLMTKFSDSSSAQPRLTRAERVQMGHHMGLKTSRTIANTSIHAILILISVIWLIPFISIVLQSFRAESTLQVDYVMPEKLHVYNYVDLLSTNFPLWYLNTFIIALFTAALQTVIVLCMSYTLSRFRFKMRKPLMRFMLILGMFPGMLTMIILYRVLSDLGLTQAHSVPGLILVYIASSGMGYYVSKGFFDTVPKSLDEAARVDGATRFQVLKKIILPLSKPIVIYTILTAFMGPWGDFVFARYIAFGTSKGMNVAVGLYSWLSKDQIASHYTMFCAGGVLVAIPVAILFMCLQKYYVEGVTGGAVKG